MKIEEIRALLEEAVTASDERRLKIHAILSKEKAPYKAEVGCTMDGVGLILDQLYTELLKIPYGAKMLPAMLPVFAIICGDREPDSIVADLTFENFFFQVAEQRDNRLKSYGLGPSELALFTSGYGLVVDGSIAWRPSGSGRRLYQYKEAEKALQLLPEAHDEGGQEYAVIDFATGEVVQAGNIARFLGEED